jgi:hypothetical protein
MPGNFTCNNKGKDEMVAKKSGSFVEAACIFQNRFNSLEEIDAVVFDIS